MPEYIQHTVNGRIINKWYSADPSVVSGLPNILELPRVEFQALTKYHIVDAGVVHLMTQTEKDALDAEEAQVAKDRLLQAIDKYEVTNIDLITALVKRINARIPANPITKQELIQQLREDLNVA